ncbi:PPK2 family polyphosphate kinase [Massilia endophytica]|uniref:PPK2 family polyphosphate kinase n=1 Tax=Massilia endophytica TaxID=2899220 RepID=UPI001E5036EE|nr:PPK2 family polyphosphate kinase [Massilia endophytica]UGQ46327.1 polyphosphate kinase 2 family protein [Massilia endophytica]
MKACDLFRTPPKLKLRDADAACTPMSAASRPGNGQLAHADIKEMDKEEAKRLGERIAELQPILYAERQRKLLLILQGTDTSGKDGAVKALFDYVNPMGLRPVAFKAPTEIEAAHDYLWRVHKEVPKAGEIAIFNRSHYEEVLITRVEGMISAGECKRRYAQIRDFERMLAETGTVIVKVFLHISKAEQKERLEARLGDPEKQWKFDPADLKQRAKWNEYLRAYERAIMETDADHAPWYIVPADSKPHRNVAVAAILLETLQAMKLKWPQPDPKLLGLKIV